MTAELFCFGESGNAYKAALTLTLSGYDWRPVKVDFFGGETRGPAYRGMNVMGEVPVFREGDLILSQSAVIQHHVATQTGRFGGRDQNEVLRWLFWDNHKLSSLAGSTRFLANFLPEPKRPQAVIDFQKARLRDALKILNTHLEGRDWVADNAPTIADFALCGYLFYPEPFGFDRTEWSHIDGWLDRIRALPGWKHPYDLMPGHPSDRA